MSSSESLTYVYPDRQAIYSYHLPNPFDNALRHPLFARDETGCLTDFRGLIRIPFSCLETIDTPDETVYRVKSDVANWLYGFLDYLHGLIKEASHGFIPSVSAGDPPSHVRLDAVRGLGLGEPSLLAFLDEIRYNVLADQFKVSDLFKWWYLYHQVARETIDWIRKSFSAAHAYQSSVIFAWEVPENLEERAFYHLLQQVIRRECHFDHHEACNDDTTAVAPTTSLILHPVLSSSARNELIPYSPQDALFGPDFTSGTRNVNNGSSDNTCRALIPHPIFGPNANNRMVPYNTCRALIRHPVLSTDADNSVVPYNACRALIPHPIFGRDAQNALVLYSPPAAATATVINSNSIASEADVLGTADNDAADEASVHSLLTNITYEDDVDDNASDRRSLMTNVSITVTVNSDISDNDNNLLVDEEITGTGVEGLRVIDFIDLPTTEDGEFL